MSSLILGIAVGLVRFGLDIPLPNYDLLIAHGTFMVCGFLGTVICLERAAATSGRIALLLPAACGLGAVTQYFYPLHGGGAWFFVAASLGLIWLYARVPVVNREGHFVQTAGAISWAVSNILLVVEFPSYVIVPWWVGFLLFTVAGERLELARVRNPPRSAIAVFLGAVILYGVGLVSGALAFTLDADSQIRSDEHGDFLDASLWYAGDALVGIATIVVAVWFFRYDLALRALRRPGLTRFSASCLLSGYVWLLAAGTVSLWQPGLIGGTPFDARLHAVFLGFVISMVFGHALIIGPGVFGFSLSYHPFFYMPMVVLHASVALRFAADLQHNYLWRRHSGILAAVSIILFVGCVAAARVRAWRESA